MKKIFGIVLAVAILFAGSQNAAEAEGECRAGMFTHSSLLAGDMAHASSKLYAETKLTTVYPVSYMGCEELVVVFSGWSVRGVEWGPTLGKYGVVTALYTHLETASVENSFVKMELEPIQNPLLQGMMWYDSFAHRDVDYTARIDSVSVRTDELGYPSYTVRLAITGFLGSGHLIPDEVYRAIPTRR